MLSSKGSSQLKDQTHISCILSLPAEPKIIKIKITNSLEDLEEEIEETSQTIGQKTEIFIRRGKKSNF